MLEISNFDQLAEKSPRKAELVKLRYFLGCTMAEAAQILGIGRTSLYRYLKRDGAEHKNGVHESNKRPHPSVHAH